MADPTKKMRELAKLLLERSSEDRITWSADPEGAPGMQFQTTIGDQLVTIRSRDNDGNHPYELSLWKQDPDDDDEWIVVETLSSAEFRGDEASRIAELWRSARGEALQINKSIDSALAALQDYEVDESDEGDELE
jgi:hypothetical protein